jgi:hypothetical protein
MEFGGSWSTDSISSHQLVRHIEEAGKVRQSPEKIVAVAPFVLRVLEKK